MSKTLTITRDMCLKAVAKEPLRQGSWIRAKTKKGRTVYNKTCQVCAVGAVFRAAGVRNSMIMRTASANLPRLGGCSFAADVQVELEKGNYLNALSCYFEGSKDFRLPGNPYKRAPLAIQRYLLGKFIERHFPESFTVVLDFYA
jgi:hypothetical protein